MGAGTASRYLPVIKKYHVAIINREDPVFYRIQKGDLVIIARGANWQKQVYFAGIASSDIYSFSKDGIEGDYTIDLTDFVDLQNGPDIPFNKQCSGGASRNPGAVYQLQGSNDGDSAVIHAVLSVIKQEKEKMLVENIKKVLEQSRNLILTGAPGTGKSFLAKQVAQAMTGDDETTPAEQSHITFVQFHPSYDYTDFVEGLRPTPPPVSEENCNIGFALKDGTFKSFCRKAVTALLDKGQDNFESAWQRLVDTLNEKGFLKIENLSNKGEFEIELDKTGTELVSRTYASESAKASHNWIDGRSKLFKKDQLYNIYRGVSGVPNGGHDNYRKAIIKNMMKDFGLLEYKVGVKNVGKKQNYVFIIDEINRGDIAKIFGELFFALDPGYRGEIGRVKTQYTNLIDKNDIFKAGFYIPENVYIIGTMNDIDRNVESMDFAIRRRFTWKKITPEDTQDAILSGLEENTAKEAKIRMDALNAAIRDEKAQLGEIFCIGAAYFKKLDDTPDKWKNLWDYHLNPLLEEYVRGLPEADTMKTKFHDAYKENEQADADTNAQG